MSEQYCMFSDEIKQLDEKNKTNKVKRNWENAFQKWSDDKHINDGTSHYGKCGYGSMCDYCADNSYGRPCVRALNFMCREKGIIIDYNNKNFEEIWDNVRSIK